MQADCRTIEEAKELAKSKGWTHLSQEEAVPYKYGTYHCNCGECYAIFFETKEKDIEPVTICNFCGKDAR